MHDMLISAAVGYRGVMMQPQTLLDVRYGGHSGYTYMPQPVATIMNGQAADTLAALMRATVLEGTATSANVDAAAVGGKTGTAKYTDNGEIHNHSWFVGYSQDPEHPLAIALSSKEPATVPATLRRWLAKCWRGRST